MPAAVALAAACSTALLIGVAPRPALAKPDGAPTVETGQPDDRARAQALLTEGYELAAQREFAPALVKFQAAYELYPSAKLLLNIGTSLRHLGRQAEAAEAYERYLSHPRADPRRRAELERLLGEIDQLVGWLTIEVAEPGALVRVNGRQLEGFSGRATFRVDPGEHTVVIERTDAPPVVETIPIGAGARRTLSFESSAADGAGSAHRNVAYGLGAVGLAGLAVGAVFGVLALTTESEIEDDPTPELERAADRYATVTYVGLAVGGAALAAAVIVYVTAPDEPTEPRVTVAMMAGEAAGICLRARW